MFLKNAWYCAGWDNDVGLGAGDLVVRRIAGRSILLYRKGNGEVVAMEDRCPHRSAPLSLGRKEGDDIRCMYHGMRFAPDGQCMEIPGMPRIPQGICVPTMPVVERNNWIWVWMGDPARADPDLICYAIGPDEPGWRLKTNHIRIETGYRQEIANLADLSHVSWVHGLTFGGSEDWSFIKPQHSMQPRGIETRYCVRNIPGPNFAKHLFPPDARFDIQVHVRLSVPCNFILSFAVHEAGDATSGPTNGKLLLDTFSSQAVTPRDEGSVDYYFSWGTSEDTYFPGIVDLMFNANAQAFLEDKRILEGQRERMLEYPDAPQVDIIHDAGPGRMLWVLDKLIEEEAREAAGVSEAA
ncbi:MAG: vanillate O-demethylase oxygenase [Sphingomonas sp. SCN 67-18]|uniref:aromatic ring-hydroxylating dioxygenase subunit alpha n=1 Tax=uncultured Sphingomonas sp. TaxID=158754 RepID=UPI00086A03C3|nr:aromatic ring-hydroxylating dioxygenase subunit alpha [Sphingomonas sp. SCN 67-18]ODU21809.1 MAG: vanillate O-demethylase oxygenase [Sphingomonas sp. SCN 67-18]